MHASKQHLDPLLGPPRWDVVCVNACGWSKCVRVDGVMCFRGIVWTTTQLYTTIHTYAHLYTPIHTYTQLHTPMHTYTHLYTPIHNYTHLYTPMHTYTHLYTTIHTYAHLYTPIHTYTHLYTTAVTPILMQVDDFSRLTLQQALRQDNPSLMSQRVASVLEAGTSSLVDQIAATQSRAGIAQRFNRTVLVQVCGWLGVCCAMQFVYQPPPPPPPMPGGTNTLFECAA